MRLTLSSFSRLLALAGLCLAGLSAACERTAIAAPAITFSIVPPAGEGGSDRMAVIAGRVTGARPGQRLVLFAKSGVWWVQPLAAEPFTSLDADGTWKTTTHLGRQYAAVLVDAGYQPPDKSNALPQPGGPVSAVAIVQGADSGTVAARSPRRLTFSGYEWDIRQVPSDRGGENDYDPANAWVDAEGFLHLRIAKHGDRWTSAEVRLTRSLGYGTYVFTVRDVSQLDPAAALGLFTWDDEGAEQNHRELDVEISRWGDLSIKNAQFVVQPYYLASNVSRFDAPAGRLTHAFRWEPARATFTTAAGAQLPASGPFIARHVFTSGVAVPGAETAHINLYYFRHSRLPLKKEVEVVIEKFQYLP